MPKVNPAPPPMPEEASDWNFDPEQPEQPSTETMADEIEGTPAPMPVKPLTDLTGVDCAPAFEGYQPNGALPETD
jgi:hypothetical protein